MRVAHLPASACHSIRAAPARAVPSLRTLARFPEAGGASLGLGLGLELGLGGSGYCCGGGSGGPSAQLDPSDGLGCTWLESGPELGSALGRAGVLGLESGSAQGQGQGQGQA